MTVFEIGGWKVRSLRGPIASIPESDQISKELGFPHPTMTFPHNSVTISNDLVSIKFDATRAILMVSKKSPDNIKVPYSKQAYWKEKQTELDYDWTYQTKYSGELEGLRSEATDLAIPYDRLKPGNGREVLFFDENILYEDEMGDNGTTVFSVKTRAMQFGIFLLARCFIRVDHVIFKSIETRYFIDFEQDLSTAIMMETRVKEEPYETVLARLGPSKLRDENYVADQLNIVAQETFILKHDSH